MYKATLALLVGLMLSVSGSAWGIELPGGNPEEHYRFALGKALQNELPIAEKAFAEFIALHPGHKRKSDAHFWLGRVQFLQAKYRDAAYTFSQFISLYPDDTRLADTSIWLAKSSSNFLPSAEACEIYKSLTQIVAEPTKSFVQELSGLAETASCKINFYASGPKANQFGEIPKTAKTQILDDKRLDRIKNHVQRNWSPTSVTIREMPVKILVEINPKGVVQKADIFDKEKLHSDKTFKAAAFAALRAVFGSSPFPLSYNSMDGSNLSIALHFGEKDPAKSADSPRWRPKLAEYSSDEICDRAVFYPNGTTLAWRNDSKDSFVLEAKRRGLNCNVGRQLPNFATQLGKVSSAFINKAVGSARNNGNVLYFDYESDVLNAESQVSLLRQASFLDAHQNVLLIIEGHTDERYTREYALGLSHRRATAVREFLVSNGVERDRVRVVPYGKERPSDDALGSKMASWQKNSRTVSIVGEGKYSTGNTFAESLPRFSKNMAKILASTGAKVKSEAHATELSKVVGKTDWEQIATTKPASSLAELESERQKRIQLEQELAALKASKAEEESKIASDNRSPTINVDSRQKDEATVVVFGKARDNTGIADLLVNNDAVPVAADGSFETSLYIPPVGLTVEIVAYDQKGNRAIETLQLKRSTSQVSQETRFAQLQPSLGKRGLANKNALALIVGIENYENLPARPSIHADNDAEYFSDFAHYKLGIPRNNIIKAINADAKRLDILKAITKVTKLSTKDETDVFIFFAGHGLAADDGEDVFLMPHDGDKDYLEATAMTRSEIFQRVERIGPKSVTVFLDACYTGGTRSQDVTLVASKRPLQVVALEQSVPSGFTILSASAADETSMALEAANHGLFSYFLMKGMEGDADANMDDKITMAEMRDYVKDKVVRQSDFQQTPELQGDADRVLVQFQ